MNKIQYNKAMKEIQKLMAKGSENVTQYELSQIKRLAVECEKFEQKKLKKYDILQQAKSKNKRVRIGEGYLNRDSHFN